VIQTVTKTDIEAELQTTLPAGYTSDIITEMIADEEDLFKLKTHRTAFTGSAARLSEKAILYMVIDRLATSNRDLIKGAVSEISENGAKVKFANGKDLASYRQEAERIIADLRLPGTAYPSELTFTNSSIASGYTPSDKTFYR
jgi:hypothetical protein